MPTLNIPIEVPTTGSYDIEALKEELIIAAHRFFAASGTAARARNETAEGDLFAGFSGDWGWDDKNTDELVADLRAARHSRDKDLAW